MTLRSASCPGCGATLDFASAATVTVVCPHCGGASYRSDVDLEWMGKVAEVAPIASPLSIGASGRYDGVGWVAIGQVQLDHGRGPWNEWCLLFDDGRHGWYAEAQGETYLTFPVAFDAAALPAWPATNAGDAVTVDGRAFVVAEVGEATLVGVKGEVPQGALPGSKRRYADLRGPDAAFGTLDYGPQDRCLEVYVGRTVDPAALGLAPEQAAPVEKKVAARRLACPSCAGVLELRDPESVRVVCASCGTLVEPTSSGAKALGKGAALKAKPLLPLGGKATLAGVAVEVIAYLVRSVTVDGVRYPWREYLLRTTKGAYRWLAESNGHWALLDPVNPGDVGRSAGGPVWKGVTFRHFQGGKARVDHVQGEVYWEVEVGETVKSDDFVSPPHLLTIEGSGREVNVTAGSYLEPAAVAQAFSVRVPSPSGVAPSQPNPYVGHTGRWWAAGLLMLVGLVVLMATVGGTRGGDAVGAFFPGLFVAAGLLLPPIVVSTRRGNFEVRRWADSDHPIGGGE